uniref:BTB domain-containing protein n=1 Tax=Graphocephala atropunctata TaxID=36148 RepID=A0A1B6LFE7_9HEMI
MDPQQQFCLKWNSFGSNLVSAFDNLFKSESLTDVTLFCEGVTFKAHKIILAACSKHFQDLFEAAPHCPSVLVILDGTSSTNMSALLEFMYKGEVHVKHESLSSFLKAAECLQVKGLSIEHEKMAEAQGDVDFDPKIDSPSRNTKSKTSTTETPNAKESSEDCPPTSMHPPSTSAYTSVMSPHTYMHHYMMQYDRAGSQGPTSSPYDNLPRKRPHRSPSDSSIRASVLRDGSKPERASPLSLTYSRSGTPPHSEYASRHPPSPAARYEMSGDNTTTVTPSSATAIPAVPFDRSAAVESDTPADAWNSSSCAEDLRVKQETPATEDRRVKKEWGGYSNEGNTEPPTPERLPANIWPINSGTSTKLASHKGSTATTTPDGKKLQCPFCERLYGYETNLRAHIRQRHQGIRVPCPFCSRTFTRNNTVRRHIAREHKTELSPFQQTDLTPFPQTELTPFQQATQVQNHNQ